MARAPERRFALVTAVYNVARYLPEFINSVESQAFDLGQVQCVAVDDGSTDDSLEILQAWRRRSPERVTVLTKPNAGQGSARNLGLDHVDATWVTFPDPDDLLDPHYLARVARAIEDYPDLAMVATNRLILQDASGVSVERHPLRALFAHGDQVKNLDAFPEFFHGSAPAAFFRTDIITEHGLRFDERIRPNFEDGHFCQRYLLRAPAPVVAFLRSAVYHYRKRADQTSTLQTGGLEESRFREVPRHGYRDLLREAARLRGGRAPEWVQNMVIYELSYYLSPEDAGWSAANVCRGEVAEEFITTLREIRQELDDEVIKGFDTRALRAHWRQVLLYGLMPGPWHSPYVVLHRYDRSKRQVLASIRYVGPAPAVEVYLRGARVRPVASKVRDFRYWDHSLLHESLMWVSARGTLRFTIDGRFVEIRTNWADYAPTYIRPAALKHRLGVPAAGGARRRIGGIVSRQKAKSELVDLAVRPARRVFRDAWVLMDRITDADDNAQRLFEYLRLHRPDINAWFVLDKQSADWPALRKRFGRRVIAHGSATWVTLMLNCRHLISSHIDAPIQRPRQIMKITRRPRWSFVFLQHGVIKDDISGWLNPKQIDLFVTSTPQEHASIVGDGSSYVFTEKEVKRTGLARFDRLLEMGRGVAESEQRLILVAPTWRNWLNQPLAAGETKRQIVDNFPTTEYARNWFGLLHSEALADLCREAELKIGFLPHPNVQPVLESVHLPPHVLALRYADHDVQRLFAEAALLVTDYSSVAFNSAYIDRPVVYFQFDQQLVELGGHLGRKGYFDFARDGFGPVALNLDDAVDKITKAVRSGRRLQSPYLERAAAAFPERDGGCCRRIVAAIEQL